MFFSDSMFSIKSLRVGSTAGVNGLLIYVSNGTKVHLRLIRKNLVNRYGYKEGSCVIPNKGAYMDNDNWTKVVKLVAPWY